MYERLKGTMHETARDRLNEEIRQHELGADNAHIINYWRAYLDGVKAQLNEFERKVTLNGYSKLYKYGNGDYYQ